MARTHDPSAGRDELTRVKDFHRAARLILLAEEYFPGDPMIRDRMSEWKAEARRFLELEVTRQIYQVQEWRKRGCPNDLLRASEALDSAGVFLQDAARFAEVYGKALHEQEKLWQKEREELEQLRRKQQELRHRLDQQVTSWGPPPDWTTYAVVASILQESQRAGVELYDEPDRALVRLDQALEKRKKQRQQAVEKNAEKLLQDAQAAQQGGMVQEALNLYGQVAGDPYVPDRYRTWAQGEVARLDNQVQGWIADLRGHVEEIRHGYALAVVHWEAPLEGFPAGGGDDFPPEGRPDGEDVREAVVANLDRSIGLLASVRSRAEALRADWPESVLPRKSSLYQEVELIERLALDRIRQCWSFMVEWTVALARADLKRRDWIRAEERYREAELFSARLEDTCRDGQADPRQERVQEALEVLGDGLERARQDHLYLAEWWPEQARKALQRSHFLAAVECVYAGNKSLQALKSVSSYPTEKMRRAQTCLDQIEKEALEGLDRPEQASQIASDYVDKAIVAWEKGDQEEALDWLDRAIFFDANFKERIHDSLREVMLQKWNQRRNERLEAGWLLRRVQELPLEYAGNWRLAYEWVNRARAFWPGHPEIEECLAGLEDRMAQVQRVFDRVMREAGGHLAAGRCGQACLRLEKAHVEGRLLRTELSADQGREWEQVLEQARRIEALEQQSVLLCSSPLKGTPEMRQFLEQFWGLLTQAPEPVPETLRGLWKERLGRVQKALERRALAGRDEGTVVLAALIMDRIGPCGELYPDGGPSHE